MNHRGHRGTPDRGKGMFVRPKLLCVLCGKCSLVLILAALLASSIASQNQTRQPTPPEKRLRYQIKLALDFENRAYTGTERVRFVNRGDHSVATLFFHLYPNVRVPGKVPIAGSEPKNFDEPRLEISEVRK